MAPPKRQLSEPGIPFDVTQEIDPAFVELLRAGPEPTLTQADFDADVLETLQPRDA